MDPICKPVSRQPAADPTSSTQLARFDLRAAPNFAPFCSHTWFLTPNVMGPGTGPGPRQPGEAASNEWFIDSHRQSIIHNRRVLCTDRQKHFLGVVQSIKRRFEPLQSDSFCSAKIVSRYQLTISLTSSPPAYTERRMCQYFASVRSVNQNSYKLFRQETLHFHIDGPERHTSHIWVDPQLLDRSTAVL